MFNQKTEAMIKQLKQLKPESQGLLMYVALNTITIALFAAILLLTYKS